MNEQLDARLDELEEVLRACVHRAQGISYWAKVDEGLDISPDQVASWATSFFIQIMRDRIPVTTPRMLNDIRTTVARLTVEAEELGLVDEAGRVVINDALGGKDIGLLEKIWDRLETRIKEEKAKAEATTTEEE